MTNASQVGTEIERLRHQQHEFMRAATHELRTPLQSIQGFVELLEPGLAREKMEHYLSIIRRDTSRLVAVVEDISQRNALEHDQLGLKPVPFSVEQLLGELSRELEVAYPDRFVVVKCSTDLPWVYVDPERLRQVLWTLLNNAARYSPAGGYRPIQLVVRGCRGQVEFAVHDDGPPIPPEYCEAIFESLAELPRVLGKRPRFGLGLGLYVAREIARRLGGDLWVEETRKPHLRKTNARGKRAKAPFRRGNIFVLSVPAAKEPSDE